MGSKLFKDVEEEGEYEECSKRSTCKELFFVLLVCCCLLEERMYIYIYIHIKV